MTPVTNDGFIWRSLKLSETKLQFLNYKNTVHFFLSGLTAIDYNDDTKNIHISISKTVYINKKILVSTL